ncbi:MAG: BrnT family toxin [Mariprofundaceae bacterium]|nr:BrnT family toxin [Mariprofundaceae bacterium]
MNYNFEWDPLKAASNLKKHGVSFEEAAEVFVDPLQLNILDEANEGEERWITLGNTKAHKLRLVVHTYMFYHYCPV